MGEDSRVEAPADVPEHLDPEDVRRRGARIRRWQNLGALVALALAVALFVLPLLVLDPGESDGPTKRGAPAPTGPARTTWDTGIRAGFPLDLAMQGAAPAPSADSPGAGLSSWRICGTSGFADQVVERLGVRARNGSLDARELVTLADEATAQALVDAVSTAVDSCEGPWAAAERSRPGDEALSLTSSGELRQLVRVGNAVLVVARDGAWTDAEAARVGQDQLAALSGRLAALLCGHALRPC